MFLFIKSLGVLVNEEHIISMQFLPAKKGYDEEEGRDYDNPARLAIQIAGAEVEKVDGYEGALLGVTSTSPVYQVRGAEAEVIWDYYLRHDARCFPTKDV